MAKRKKPDNETPEEADRRRLFEGIITAADRSSRTAWDRKMRKMQKLLRRLEPIEEQILELQAQKIPIYDEIQAIRQDMVRECVHPYDYLVEKDGYVYCKFCEARIRPIR